MVRANQKKAKQEKPAGLRTALNQLKSAVKRLSQLKVKAAKKKQAAPPTKEIAGKRKVSADAQADAKPKKPKVERRVIPKRAEEAEPPKPPHRSERAVNKGGKLRILSQFLQGVSSIASSLLQESENDAFE